VPKLWNETIDAHRRDVREAILGATAKLVNELGLRGVTMSQIAEETGIGRATLYKYFKDVETILLAWHERHVGAHLEQLSQLRDQSEGPAAQLEAVLEAFALMEHQHEATELTALLHRGEHVARTQKHLHDMVRGLLAAGAKSGDFRHDVTPEELARYCLHALTAAGGLRSKAAVHRLVAVTLSGLRPPR
jgi:AcrR family transcriptional regulator